MERLVIGAALASLAVMPVAADPTPTQTPAQLQSSANVSADAQMPSQEAKAAARQSSKTEAGADKAASNNNPTGGISTDLELQQKTATPNSSAARMAANEDDQPSGKVNAGPVTDQQLAEKAAIDNGVNDGGVAAQTVTP
jgi:hypothetical protein